MTINEITRKLIRQNKSRYLLFGRSITDVLMTDGSTYIVSLGMYGITMTGIVVFFLC